MWRIDSPPPCCVLWSDCDLALFVLEVSLVCGPCSRAMLGFVRGQWCGLLTLLYRCVGELPSSGKFFPYIDEADHQLDAGKPGRRTGELVGVLLGRIITPANKEELRLCLNQGG